LSKHIETQRTRVAARIDAEIKVVFTKLGAARNAAHLNQVIRSHSETSVVSMMHLRDPPPPAAAAAECEAYVDELGALTQGLPLAMMVATAQREAVITTAI
jgi:hypothetical protein